MKRKLLHGLLAFAVLLVSTTTFSSCKDTNEDLIAISDNSLRAELEKQVSLLEDKLDELKKENSEDLAKSKAECKKQLDELTADLVKAQQELQDAIGKKADQTAVNALEARVKQLESQMADVLLQLASIDADIATAQANIDANADAILQIKAILEGLGFSSQSTGAIVITDPASGSTQELTLQGAIDYVNGLIYSISLNLQEQQNEITALKPDIRKGVDAYDWAQRNENRIKALEDNVAQYKAFIEQNYPDNDALTSALTSLENNIRQTIDALQTEIDNIKGELNDAFADIDDTNTRIDNLIDTYNQQITNILTALDDKASKASVDAAVSKITANENAISQLGAKYDALAGRITTLETQVESLLGMTDRINQRLNKLITGVLIQGTYNPVFGSFSLPVGIQSNMLLAYTGKSENTLNFPDNNSSAEYDGTSRITDADMAILRQGANFSQLSVTQDDILCNWGEGNAGKVYLTINPNTVDFTGVTLELVNSRDESSSVSLSPLKKSEDLLTFGVSRADNGFYEANATISTPEAIEASKINIDSKLKSSVRQVLDDLCNHNSTENSLPELAQSIYNQFNGFTPAYALKASWTAPDINGNDVTHAVYSQYALAAACFEPLSFKYLYGESLPNFQVITPLTGFEFDLTQFTFNLDFPPITLDGVTLSFTLEHVSVNVEGNIVVKIKVPDVIDNGDGTYTILEKTVDVVITPNDLASFISQIESSINSKIDGWTSEIQSKFNSAIETLVAQIQTQVNNELATIQGQINDNISDLLEDIESELNGNVGDLISKTNEYINIYNSVIGRLNNIINNLNNCLQPVIIYRGADGHYYQLSNSAAIPTPFVLVGEDAIALLPTTYTGEIAAPVYKKFIGVTNVWNTNDPSVSAQNGNDFCVALAKEANSREFMCTPINGNIRRVPFISDLRGYTYEIVYSALDYSGVTSTRKFYISVD